MFTRIKRWLAARKLPADTTFLQRAKSPQRVGWYVLVEIGAAEYTVLMDLLYQIQRSEDDIETKGRQIIGLRYQALAMSLRTPGGRIPFDWQNERDLMQLAALPYSVITPALEAAAELSELPWLSINQSQPVSEGEPQDAPAPLDKEAVAANP